MKISTTQQLAKANYFNNVVITRKNIRVTIKNTMSEQPEEIKRSWALQSSFMTGPVVINKLVPAPYGKIRTNFVQTWREESQPAVDWEVTNQSMYIPESIRCVSAVYLKINLGAAKFKAYPGLYIIKTFRLRSAGQIVYECDYAQFLVDYCESISDQKLRQFATHLFGGGNGRFRVHEHP